MPLCVRMGMYIYNVKTSFPVLFAASSPMRHSNKRDMFAGMQSHFFCKIELITVKRME